MGCSGAILVAVAVSRALWSGTVPALIPPGRYGCHRAPAPMTKDTQAMDTTQDVDTDVAPTDDEISGAAVTQAAEIPGPPVAERIDVRRRVMALRRW